MTSSPDRVAILLPLGVAVTLTFCTVIIHALALMPIIYFVRYELRHDRAGVLFWRDVGIVAGATLVALAAHLIAVAAWAVVFTLSRRIFPPFRMMYRRILQPPLGFAIKSSWRHPGSGANVGRQRYAIIGVAMAVCSRRLRSPENLAGGKRNRDPEKRFRPLACHLKKGISHERTQQESAQN